MQAVWANQQRVNRGRGAPAAAPASDASLLIGLLGLLLLGCIGGWIIGAGNLIDGWRIAAFVVAGVCTAALLGVGAYHVCMNQNSSTGGSSDDRRAATTYATVVHNSLPPLVTLPAPAPV